MIVGRQPPAEDRMDFHFYSPNHFETWDYRNPDVQGIGGSETSAIEMSLRLARRRAGHNVVNYCPLPLDCPNTFHGGVHWRPLAEATLAEPGVWCLYRTVEALDRVQEYHPGREFWVICQDEDYPWNEYRLKKVDRVVALCWDQARQFLARYPVLEGRVCVSSNGLKPDLVDATLALKLPRDPKRLTYASSPDRGLHALLKIYERVREMDPGFSLTVCYGFDNIDVYQAGLKQKLELSPGEKAYLGWVESMKHALKKLPGVTHLGRLPQAELYRQWAQTGLWVYPPVTPWGQPFRETSCITCMEAQALGAIPVTTPLWAVGENVRHGIFIDGNPQETWPDFAAEVIKLGNDPEAQARCRGEMMPWARDHFSWERSVDQWEEWAVGLQGRLPTGSAFRECQPLVKAVPA